MKYCIIRTAKRMDGTECSPVELTTGDRAMADLLFDTLCELPPPTGEKSSHVTMMKLENGHWHPALRDHGRLRVDGRNIQVIPKDWHKRPKREVYDGMG